MKNGFKIIYNNNSMNKLYNIFQINQNISYQYKILQKFHNKKWIYNQDNGIIQVIFLIVLNI